MEEGVAGTWEFASAVRTSDFDDNAMARYRETFGAKEFGLLHKIDISAPKYSATSRATVARNV